MRKILSFLCVAICVMAFFPVPASAQTESSNDISFDLQAYQSGLIAGIRLEKQLGKMDAVNIRLGFQYLGTDDLTNSYHDFATGYGLSLGYKSYFQPGREGFSLSLRADLWYNIFGYDHFYPNDGSYTATEKVLLIQPTLEVAYLFNFGPFLILTPSLAVDYKYKIDGYDPKNGGASVYVGLSVGKRFYNGNS